MDASVAGASRSAAILESKVGGSASGVANTADDQFPQLSPKRAAYSVGELLHLLQGAASSSAEVARQLFVRFDSDVLELLMVLVLVILLNLLIAIMGSSYEKVHHSAELEVLREKSLIILDIERFLLPVYIKWFKKDVEELFPRWLHVLVPVSMIESEGHTPVLRESGS